MDLIQIDVLFCFLQMTTVLCFRCAEFSQLTVCQECVLLRSQALPGIGLYRDRQWISQLFHASSVHLSFRQDHRTVRRDGDRVFKVCG